MHFKNSSWSNSCNRNGSDERKRDWIRLQQHDKWSSMDQNDFAVGTELQYIPNMRKWNRPCYACEHKRVVQRNTIKKRSYIFDFMKCEARWDARDHALKVTYTRNVRILCSERFKQTQRVSLFAADPRMWYDTGSLPDCKCHCIYSAQYTMAAAHWRINHSASNPIKISFHLMKQSPVSQHGYLITFVVMALVNFWGQAFNSGVDNSSSSTSRRHQNRFETSVCSLAT